MYCNDCFIWVSTLIEFQPAHIGINGNKLEDIIQSVSYYIANAYDGGWRTSITWKSNCKFNCFFFLYGSISISVGSGTFENRLFRFVFFQVELRLGY